MSPEVCPEAVELVRAPKHTRILLLEQKQPGPLHTWRVTALLTLEIILFNPTFLYRDQSDLLKAHKLVAELALDPQSPTPNPLYHTAYITHWVTEKQTLSYFKNLFTCHLIFKFF